MNPNLNDPRHPWARLTAASRHLRDQRDPSAPFGFATRVAALAFAQERKFVSLFDRFALQALGVAGLLALSSVALNYRVVAGWPMNVGAASSSAEDEILPVTDAVSVVLDLAD